MIYTIKKNKFTSKKINLYIVRNEIQIYNAQEAHFLENDCGAIYLLIINKNDNNTERLIKLIKKINLNILIILKNPSIRYDIKAINILRQYSFNKVFIGYFTQNMRQYIASLIYEKIYIIDDGTYTLVLYHELCGNYNFKLNSMLFPRKIRNSIYLLLIYKVKKIFREAVFYLSGLKNDLTINNINFFSIYKIDSCNRIDILRNKYLYLKKKYEKNLYTKKEQKEIVYFIGQPFNNLRYIDETKYKKLLLYVKNYYKDKIIYFFPHKRRSDIFKTVEESLSSEIFKIININKSFEIYFLEQNIIPHSICSFFSSTLFTMRVIFPDLKITSFKIVSEKNTKDINFIYDEFKNNNINMINIDIKNII